MQKILSDLIYTLSFGVFSAGFGMIEFQIAGYGNSDMREIPLLIALAYIRNRWFVVVLGFTTLFYVAEGIPPMAHLLMHIIPLFIAWHILKFIERQNPSYLVLGLSWGGLVLVYYYVLLIPLLILSLNLFGINLSVPFFEEYRIVVRALVFEVFATTLITSLYIIQLDIRRTLRFQNENLELIVKDRTHEIVTANNALLKLNEELTASNEMITILNGNLEQLVEKRTAKIREQVDQLTQYAHMNSHEVRGPLARVLGLIGILDRETDETKRTDLLEKLMCETRALDEVVGKMNRLLEQEIPDDSTDDAKDETLV